MSQKAFANVEDTVDYLLGSDICETMTVIPPNHFLDNDCQKITDQNKVDEENLDAPIICDIPGEIKMLISTKSLMNNKTLQHQKGQDDRAFQVSTLIAKIYANFINGKFSKNICRWIK